MTADPDGSSMAQARAGAVGEASRADASDRDRWRGPGWRVVDASAEHGRLVRDWVSGVVARHGGPADPGDAALVAGELFANALMHGPLGGRVLAGYCLWPGGARLVVCDAGGPAVPRLRDPGELEEGGRGLRVVDAVAAAWGSFRAGDARAVWCDLGKPPDTIPASGEWAWLRAILASVALGPAVPAVFAGNSPARVSPGRRVTFVPA